MGKFFAFGAVLFLAFAVSEISGLCCGRGKHGYCNDCSKTSLFGHRKCCGIGSGHGHGCNIFCCNCGACRKGIRTVQYKSGWVLGKRYTCVRHYGDAQNSDSDELQDTWDAFNELDKDNDLVISPDEFIAAMTSGLTDSENAHLLASDLLRSNDAEAIGDFLDSVGEEKSVEDMTRLVVREFRSMDTNENGFIEAKEFDKVLE